ncbi:MAG: hypothetical protein K6E99_04950 [Bacilli bacterium]|nr:hypothetical protein [Bacilli bacterium]
MENKVTLNEYEKIIEKLSKLVKYYDIVLEDNTYDMFLANGDRIYLTFPKGHIAHLLGVYTEKLKKGTNPEDSYKLLKKLIDSNPSYFDLKRIFGEDNVGAIFSNYIDRKLETFVDTLKVRTDDIYCVIKYKTDRSYATGENTQNSDYFIIRQHDKKYSALGICKGDGYNNYLPVTLRLFEDEEELKQFLEKIAKHQEITYPTLLKIVNEPKSYNNTVYSTQDDKLELSGRLIKLGKEFEAIPSNTSDSKYIIEKAIDGKQRRFNNYSILKNITECIKEGTFIDKKAMAATFTDNSMPSDISELIDASNDIICSNYTHENYEIDGYSQVKNENIALQSELEALKLTLAERDALISSLQDEKTQLIEKNEKQNEKLNIYNEAFEKVRGM